MIEFIKRLLANTTLQKAVLDGNVEKVRRALSHGANPNLEIYHSEPLNYATPGFLGAWTMVNDGDILSYAMQKGFDEIGRILADAGGKVPPRYHERIVSQRWQHRLARAQENT